MKAMSFFVGKVLIKSLSLFSFLFIGFVTASCGQDTPKATQAEKYERQQVKTGMAVKTVTMPVEGMSCGSCVSSIKKTVKSLEGVQQVSVSLEKRQATVTYAQEKISPEQIREAIQQKGYKTGKMVEVKTQ